MYPIESLVVESCGLYQWMCFPEDAVRGADRSERRRGTTRRVAHFCRMPAVEACGFPWRCLGIGRPHIVGGLSPVGTGGVPWRHIENRTR